MKIILLDRAPGMSVDIEGQLRVMADSALVVTGRPLFLPDFSSSWTARVYLAYRIGRLGKTIKAKFAFRYYDAITLALRLMPSDLPECSALCSFFDSALALGPFITLGGDTYETSINIAKSLTFENLWFNHDPALIAEVIEGVSKYGTLRNGDLIMTEYQSLDVEISPKTDFRGSIGEMPFTLQIR